MKYCYGYVHGFASGATSSKGLYLRQRIAETTGEELVLFNVNGADDFRFITLSSAVKGIARVDEEKRKEIGSEFKWRLIGSSLGGHAVLLFAQQHPDRVDRIVSICPALRLRQIFEQLVGSEGLNQWESTGVRLWPKSSTGEEVPVSFEFMRDAATHADFPNPPHDTLIIHGELDEVVPIASSYQYVKENSTHRSIVCVPRGDHALSSGDTLELLFKYITDFLMS